MHREPVSESQKHGRPRERAWVGQASEHASHPHALADKACIPRAAYVNPAGTEKYHPASPLAHDAQQLLPLPPEGTRSLGPSRGRAWGAVLLITPKMTGLVPPLDKRGQFEFIT